MHCNILHSRYVIQAESLWEQLFKCPQNALSAADRFGCMQCFNTDIITNWQMTAAKASELFEYFQMW